MKKRSISFLLVLLCLILVMCGCNKGTSSENPSSNETTDSNGTLSNVETQDNDKTSTEIKHTGIKLEGNIIGASEFSEGLAFVCINERVDKVYCVTTDGYIVFEFDVDKYSSFHRGKIDARFVNGLALFNNVIYDVTGKETRPEDVGVDFFYDNAFEGGYILANKLSSPTSQCGVLDFNFNWVQPLSEEFYNIVGESLSLYHFDKSYKVIYCAKDQVYLNKNDSYLNLKNGEESTTPPTSILSSCWELSYYPLAYKTYDDTIVVETDSFANVYRLGFFLNGKAPIVFYDSETDTATFSLINEDGDLVFDPVQLEHKDAIIDYDGKDTILIELAYNAYEVTATTYSASGDYKGTISETSVEEIYLGEDIVLVIGESYANYFNADFTPLF